MRAFASRRKSTPSVTQAVNRGLASPVRPLPAETRRDMQARFQHDFSRVRVHADSQAATESAAALQARAYTFGRDIVFGAGEFSTHTEAGRMLLAHELAHAVQQSGVGDTAGVAPQLGHPQDRAEAEAGRPWPAAGGSSAETGPVVRRAPTVPTWSGKMEASKYDETYLQSPRDNLVNAGATIHLIFHADDVVDAEEIGFLQTITTLVNDAPYALNKTAGSRSIPAGDAGEGAHVDVGAASPSAITQEQVGVHYSDDKNAYLRDAEMTDPSGIRIRDTDKASMEMQTAAVAKKGAQKGTIYGAVKWGWTREPSQRPQKLEFAPAGIVPGGSLFPKLARLWNASKTSAGLATEHLASVETKYITKPARLIADPAKKAGAVALDVNTTVELLEATTSVDKALKKVTVVSGAHKGKVGWVDNPLSDREIIIPKRRR